MSPTSDELRLAALHDHYTQQINAAVGAGRTDLVHDLANAYQDEALELLLAQGDRRDQLGGPVETLELGADWPSWRSTGRSVGLRFRRWRQHHG